MKLILSWLADFIELKPGTTPEQLGAALVQLGHEIDGIETTGQSFPQVVIGRVLERVPHPNAERLGVCQVDVGEAAPRQIVCGAPNARAGLTVAVALPGAVLPGDFKIKSSKIRDVLSDGMICSVRELGLGDEHEGIWELETEVAFGTPLAEILPPPEVVLDVALTPNRGDCFSHLGLARELAALGMGALKLLPELTLPETAEPAIRAAISAPEDCLQLNLLPVAGLRPNVPSPALVQQRLKASGQRPKNALVDVTTYVMLGLGQPLHAYDADKVQGDTLTARLATNGESFDGLTGSSHTLTAEDLVIADAEGAEGLAGVLGGARSAVSDTTTRVVLEAAVFNPVSIAFAGQRHQLHTDARQRFERGIDPAMSQYALRTAASLLTQWAGSEALQVGIMVTAGAGVKAPAPIAYSPDFFTRFIGMEVEAGRQREILKRLGFDVKEGAAGWQVTPPTWRTYMATPEDITEEILRVVGYETVPHQLPTASPAQFGVDGKAVTLDRSARKALALGGFLEVITYSFIGAEDAARFAPQGATLLGLANPLAQTDMTTMRPSLLPGVLGAMAKNFAASDATARLAEVGKVFVPKGGKTGEALMTAGVLAATGARHWQQTELVPDVFSAKAAVMQLLGALNVPLSGATVVAEAPAHYHPGRSGTVQVGPFTLAHFGELHPALRTQYDIPAHAGPLAVFEVHLEPLLKLSSKARGWQPMPFPPVKRDVSLIVDETLPAAAVLATLAKHTRSLPGGIQVQAEVFDRYQGKGVDEGKVALGLALTLQSPEKTLTEADIAAVLTPILAAWQEAHGAKLRA